MLTVIVRSAFEEDGKYYSQFFRWMLQHDRTDISEWIDINKTGVSKERIICHNWYFRGIGYKFDPQVCNGCHDILMMACELKNIAILNVKDVQYRCVYGIWLEMMKLICWIILN